MAAPVTGKQRALTAVPPMPDPRYWCNKCGYRGTDQLHKRPTEGECPYIGRVVAADADGARKDSEGQAVGCSMHPDAPHGFSRNASPNAGRYVGDCEGWEPPDATYEEWAAAVRLTFATARGLSSLQGVPSHWLDAMRDYALGQTPPATPL
jgi:hypothetical protein